MRYLSAAFGLLFLSYVTAIDAANAREEEAPHGAPPQQAHPSAPPQQARPSAPPQQARMSAPPQQMRMSAPPQQMRMSAPPQQMRMSAPPQQMRMSAPPQQMRMSAPPQQMRMSAPPQQMRMGANPQQMHDFPQQTRMSAYPQQMRMGAYPQQMRMGVPPEQRHENTHAQSQAERPKEYEHSPSAERSASKESEHLRSDSEQKENLTAKSGRENSDNFHNQNRTQTENMSRGEHASSDGLHTERETRSKSENRSENRMVPPRSAFTNPRRINTSERSREPHFTKNRDRALSWHPGANNIPRSGTNGRAGIMDPGGYIRSGRASSLINSNYAQQQLSSMPNYNNNYNGNNSYRNGNSGQWPWQPQFSWNPFNWNQGLGLYNNYWFNGAGYPLNYFALQSFSPTQFLFNPMYGQFWSPGLGYTDQLPYGYNAPITISVEQVVPVYGWFGNVVSYQTETFNYNAFWDPNAQAYGYYDYQGQFHWVTYPAFESWG